jgi:hypothetical protein
MSRRLVCIFLIACGGNSGNGDGGDGPMPDAPKQQQVDTAKCTPFAKSFADASTACGTPVSPSEQAALEGFCKKGATVAAMCGGNPAGGLDCFATPDPTDWTCQLGAIYPACNGDLASALGALCIVALGNPRCASGIKCQFDVDCSGNSACNDATGQCFDKGAYCIGMPCMFDVDCPTNEKCNGAEHACVGR